MESKTWSQEAHLQSSVSPGESKLPWSKSSQGTPRECQPDFPTQAPASPWSQHSVYSTLLFLQVMENFYCSSQPFRALCRWSFDIPVLTWVRCVGDACTSRAKLALASLSPSAFLSGSHETSVLPTGSPHFGCQPSSKLPKHVSCFQWMEQGRQRPVGHTQGTSFC